jgi:hypothetical protein
MKKLDHLSFCFFVFLSFTGNAATKVELSDLIRANCAFQEKRQNEKGVAADTVVAIDGKAMRFSDNEAIRWTIESAGPGIESAVVRISPDGLTFGHYFRDGFEAYLKRHGCSVDLARCGKDSLTGVEVYVYACAYAGKGNFWIRYVFEQAGGGNGISITIAYAPENKELIENTEPCAR